MTTFEVGDRVSYIDGRTGRVTEIDTALGHVWLSVDFDNGGSLCCADGYWTTISKRSRARAAA